jgi:hypothetical protein
VKPDGARYWRTNDRFGDKQKTLAVGVYPTVTLADARQRRGDTRWLVTNGTVPGEVRKAEKAALAEAVSLTVDTFETATCDWLKKRAASRSSIWFTPTRQ